MIEQLQRAPTRQRNLIRPCRGLRRSKWQGTKSSSCTMNDPTKSGIQAPSPRRGFHVSLRRHLRHARAAVAFDILLRYLQHLGYEVTCVGNFTDIDDKGTAAQALSRILKFNAIT